MTTEPQETPANVQHVQEQVTVERSVRYPRLILGGAVVGVVVGALLTLLFPVGDDYTLGQILGFMALVCGTIGLALGALFAIILDRAARKHRYTATAMRISTNIPEGSE